MTQLRSIIDQALRAEVVEADQTDVAQAVIPH